MKKLKIAILSKLVSPTVTHEFMPELEARGHAVTVIDMSIVPINGFSQHPLTVSLYEYDIVYYRTGLSRDGAIFLEKLLKAKNVRAVNLHYLTHPFAHDKTYETHVASEAGLYVPITLTDCNQTFAYAAEILGSPFVAKPNFGTQGNGVKLIKNETDLLAYIEDTKDTKTLLQECIPHDCEYRVHTVGGKTEAMYKRTPAPGDFRSNVSTGGAMHPVEPELVSILSTLAEQSAHAFNFEILATDFMHHKETGDFYFTEINLNPGWEISDKDATNVDLTAITADYFESLFA